MKRPGLRIVLRGAVLFAVVLVASVPGHACPLQTAQGLQALCGKDYGGIIKYCYSGTDNWWFKERVVNGTPNTCQGGLINQTTNPIQSPSGCVSDEITNSNGPPANVAPCVDVTDQVVYLGPTQERVYEWSHNNVQRIEVTQAPNRVLTSSGGAQTACTF